VLNEAPIRAHKDEVQIGVPTPVARTDAAPRATPGALRVRRPGAPVEDEDGGDESDQAARPPVSEVAPTTQRRRERRAPERSAGFWARARARPSTQDLIEEASRPRPAPLPAALLVGEWRAAFDVLVEVAAPPARPARRADGG